MSATKNNNTNKNIDNIVVPYDFNWETTKDINIEITLPYDIGLMRTKILSPEGIKLFYKQQSIWIHSAEKCSSTLYLISKKKFSGSTVLLSPNSRL